MEQTSNYKLSQWAGEDRILREDFNADNVKTENALAEQADQLAPVAAKIGNLGNCQIYYKSYTGTGETTISHTFPNKPLMVFISQEDGDHAHRFIRGCTSSICDCHSSSFYPSVTWDNHTMTLYSSRASENMNYESYTYHLVALLDMSAE